MCNSQCSRNIVNGIHDCVLDSYSHIKIRGYFKSLLGLSTSILCSIVILGFKCHNEFPSGQGEDLNSWIPNIQSYKQINTIHLHCAKLSLFVANCNLRLNVCYSWISMHSDGIGFTHFSPRNSDPMRSDRKFNPNRDLTWPLIFMCVHSAFTAEIVKKGKHIVSLALAWCGQITRHYSRNMYEQKRFHRWW